MSPMSFGSARRGDRRSAVALALLVATVWLGGCGSESAQTGSTTGGLACKGVADCAALEDGDACNGTMRCDATLGICILDVATIVHCDAANDSACAQNRCDPKSGSCAPVPAAKGSACDDGDPCTTGDRCEGTTCAAGPDSCACHSDADCPDDGDLCNGSTYCDTKSFPYACKLKPGSLVSCSGSEGPCVTSTCAPKTGACVNTAVTDGSACDDDNPCTAGESCSKGACKGGTEICACTVDADCPDLDGDPCTGVPYCDSSGGKGSCKTNPATVVQCATDADTACVKNQCEKAFGGCKLKPVADKSPCDDGDSCTKGEVCFGGGCTLGTDTCKCNSDADCKGTDDGNLCNGTPFCNLASGKCETNPATVVVCPTVGDTACAKNVCMPTTGSCSVVARAETKQVGCQGVDLGGGLVVQVCLYAAKQGGETGDPGPYVCEDGDTCTKGDTCDGKGCKAGKVVCECSKDADCSAKDDGNLCNGVMFCNGSSGKCEFNPASEVFCPKGQDSDCLKNTCTAKTGLCAMQPAKAGTTCDDDNPCTEATTCSDGACAGGKPNACDDGNPCTIDSCAKDKGCQHVAKPCDDGNSCTASACDAKLGTCNNAPLQKGTACNGDNDGCTVGDSCDGKGACVSGGPAVCAAKTGICQHNACQSKGADGFSCAIVSDADGTACEDGDDCLLGAACQGGSCKVGKGEAVWAYAPKVTGLVAFEGATFLSAALPGGIEGGVGGAVVAGAVTSGADKGTWLVQALGADGKVVWSTKVSAPSGVTTLGAVRAVLDRGPLGVAVVGRATRGDGSQTAVASLIDVAGKAAITWAASKDVSTSFRLENAALHPTGNLVLSALPLVGDKTVVVAMVGPTGTTTWQWSELTYSPRGNHLLCLADGTIVAGYALWSDPKDPTPRQYYLVGLNATGKRLWELSQSPGGPEFELTTLVQTPAGPLRAQVRLRDPQGKDVLAQWFSVDPKTGGVVDLVRAVEVADAAYGGARAGDDIAFWTAPGSVGVGLGRADRFGNVQWVRAVGDGPTAVAGLAVAPGAQRLMLFGAAGAGAAATAAARVVDLWGYGSCAARGSCAGKTWQSCNDDQGCTNDRCDGATGCAHLPQGDNLCDPGVSCTHEGHCTTGACVAHSYGRTFVNGYFDAEIAAAGIDQADAGRLDVWRRLDNGAPLSKGFAHTLMWLADGQLGDDGELELLSLEEGATRVMRSPSGKLLAVGRFKDGGRMSLRYSLSTPDHQTQLKTGTIADTTCKSCDLQLQSVTRAADGGFYLAGFDVDGGGKALLARIGGDGAVQWLREQGGLGQPLAMIAVTGRANGGVAFAGQTASGNAIVPVVGWLSAANTDYVSVVDAQSVNGNLFAIAERSDTSVVAVGSFPSGATQTGLLLAISLGKQIVWRKVATLADGIRYNNVVALPGAELVVGGEQVGGGKTSLVLERRSSSGALLWQRVHRYLDTNDIRPIDEMMLPLADGGFALVVAADSDGNGVWGQAVARSDASGHFSCLEAGGCATKAVNTCDDSNPCTSDFCDAKLGCQHGAIEGLSCGGGGVCVAGKCVQP